MLWTHTRTSLDNYAFSNYNLNYDSTFAAMSAVWFYPHILLFVSLLCISISFLCVPWVCCAKRRKIFICMPRVCCSKTKKKEKKICIKDVIKNDRIHSASIWNMLDPFVQYMKQAWLRGQQSLSTCSPLKHHFAKLQKKYFGQVISYWEFKD